MLINQKRHEGSGSKLFFVTSGQMFGSGKTELGRNATSILAHQSYKKQRESLERTFTKKVVEDYINAITIWVDVRELENEGNLDRSLGLLLAKRVGQVLDRKMKPEELETFKSVLRVVEFLQENYPDQSFFIHWDEVIPFFCIYRKGGCHSS